MQYPRLLAASVAFFTSTFVVCASSNAAPQIEVDATLDVGYFYDQLSPYGEWIEDANYGYVWSPNGVDADWRPYTRGHWVYTDDEGWLWVADEEWGWGPYHYGRWFLSSNRWLWVPGNDWAPAWCSWRTGGGYIGWAPLPPQASFSAGVGLQIGAVQLDAYVQPSWYSFVEERHFAEPQVVNVIVRPAQNVTILQTTRNITSYSTSGNRIVNRGVAVETVEHASGHAVARVKVVQAAASAGPHRPQVSGNQVTVFRPAIKAAPAGKKPIPPSIARAKGLAPTSRPGTPAPPASGRAPSAEVEAQRAQLAEKHAQEKAELDKKHQQEVQNPPKGAPLEQVQARHQDEQKALEKKQADERAELEKKHPTPKATPPPKPTPKPSHGPEGSH